MKKHIWVVALGIILSFVLLSSAYAGQINPSYNPKIIGRGGELLNIGSFTEFSKSSSILAALPYSENSGGKVQLTAFSNGKKISLSLTLYNSQVVSDSDDLIIAKADARGSWFNGKKNIRSLDLSVEYSCNRLSRTINLEGSGDLDFRIINMDSNYC